MDIIVLMCFYILIVYTVINYSSLAYFDGSKRLVSHLFNVVRFELGGMLFVRLLYILKSGWVKIGSKFRRRKGK